MKRHPTLQPFSRFHRSVLFLALVCKKNAPAIKGYPVEADEKRTYALKFYNENLRSHFDRETEALWVFKGRDHDLDRLMEEIAREKLLIKDMFKALSSASKNLTSDLDELGQGLENLIRKEERQLFQKIQEIYSAGELDKIRLASD